MKKAAYILLIMILFLITVVLVFTAVTRRDEATPETTATPTPSVQPYASLSFSPTSLSISSPSATQTVDILIDTDGKGVFGAQIELQYDPNVISNVSITPSEEPFFGENSTVLIDAVTQSEGRATYAVGMSPNEEERIGKGMIATLTFQVTGDENTEIAILPTSSINNLRDTGSVLLNAATLPITINR